MLKNRNLKKLIRVVDEKLIFNLLKKTYFFFLNFKIGFIFFFYKKKQNFFSVSLYNNNNSLTKLFELHKSDKGSVNHYARNIWGWKAHTYSNHYYSLFNHFKDDVKLVFELGLGTNNPNFLNNMTVNGVPGSSLRVWRDYFINAQIYGADIDKDILFKENRIKTYYTDSLNATSIKIMWKKIGIQNFDIIIDDGLHTTTSNVNFFINSFNKLKKNGIYIIEDVNLGECRNLMQKLKKWNPEFVNLQIKNIRYPNNNNNLVIIRND
jgi:hypothetical protein